jgi:L-lactate dehydrogenase (cytochrome)
MPEQRRRLPRWEELEPLLGFQAPALTRAERMARAGSILDLRRIAYRRTPRAVFDYVDGAAESETSLRRARRAFRDVEFQPSVLRDVSEVDTSRTIMGKRSPVPFVLAPTGFTRMMHAEGEPSVARAAQAHGITYSLSTLGTTSPEGVAEAAPDLRRWFQLYVATDRKLADELLDRAGRAGFETLILTVDTAVGGLRLRDVRNGLTVPPKLTARTFLDMSIHPSWWMDLLTTEPLEFASLASFDGTVAELLDAMFDPTVKWADLDWLRERWDGPIVLKGIQSVTDAEEAVRRGVDGIVLSNHGGRQLDRAPTPFLQVPEVVDAVGDDLEVYVDGGITNGADIIAAIAAGARAALVGRVYLYGLMAGGYDGVNRALEILQADMERTLRLLGVTAVDDLTREHVRLPRPQP